MTSLGAQMYTAREFTKDAAGLLQSLQTVKAMGYKAVQLSGHGADIPVSQIADFLQETGLVCGATHVGFDRLQNDFDAVVKMHKAWNCIYPGVGSMPEQYRSSEEGFVAFAKDASEIARRFEDEGMHFIYHNHQFEFQRFGGKTGMDILLENSDPALQFELDTYWVQTGGADILQWIKKVEGRMDVVHFKDMTINRQSQQEMAEIGSGNMNWDAIIAACRQIGVKWYFVEQDVCQRSPFESLKMSYDFLTQKGVE